MLDNKQLYKCRIHISRLSNGNQPIINANGMFSLSLVKQNDVNTIVSRLHASKLIDKNSIHYYKSKIDYSDSRALINHNPSYYYTIDAKIDEKALIKSKDVDFIR